MLAKSRGVKVYISFDADRDMHHYRIMESWNRQSSGSFINVHCQHKVDPAAPESEIKRKLKKRLQTSDVFILLIGERTRYLYKYVRWEIDQALQCELPIVCMNLNGCEKMDMLKCPPILKNVKAWHLPFDRGQFEVCLYASA